MLVTPRHVSSTVQDPASFGTAVAGFIGAQEDELQVCGRLWRACVCPAPLASPSSRARQSALEELFERMGTETLKDIRRALPFSQKKMDWNVAAHRMTKTLRK